MDLTALAKQLADLTAALPAMQAAVKERATQEAVDGGAAIAVRPWSFRHPLKGECDPWFGITYHEWLALRNAGFKGIYTTGDPSSDRAKLYIIYDEAALFLKARAAAQCGSLSDRSESTARLLQARKQKGEAAAA